MTESVREALVLVEKAREWTRELQIRDPSEYLFAYAEKQLATMGRILEQGRSPTETEKASISVGRMAIREFEGGPLNDYAIALEEASGAFDLL